MNVCEEYRAQGRCNAESLRTATYEELLELKLLVDTDIGNISSQLDTARADFAKDRIYADPNWFRRAKDAVRIKGQFSQQIQIELARRRRAQKEKSLQERQERDDRFTRRLLIAMGLILSPEQREAVLAKAEELRHREEVS